MLEAADASDGVNAPIWVKGAAVPALVGSCIDERRAIRYDPQCLFRGSSDPVSPSSRR